MSQVEVVVSMQSKVASLAAELKASFKERGELIDATLLAILAKEHVYALGPPGTGKSLVLHTVAESVQGARYFRTLLGKASQKDQVFGPLDIKELQEGKYQRKTAKYLPAAHFGFLDEVYKANDAILHDLLTLMAERIFEEDGVLVKAPVVTIMAASNELPDHDNLAAHHDRYTLRVFVDRIQDPDELRDLLDRGVQPISTAFTLEDLENAQKEAAKVAISGAVLDALVAIRYQALEKGLDISDRRLMAAQRVVKAHAYLNGRSNASMRDLIVLRHILWTRIPERSIADDIVYQFASPHLQKAKAVMAKVAQVDSEIQAASEEEALGVVSQGMANMKRAMKDVQRIRADAEGSGEEADIDAVMDRIQARIVAITQEYIGG